jgi:hypothetical protein
VITKYKIISTDPEDHSIVVRFFTNVITEQALAIRNPDTGEIIRNEDGTIQSCRTDYNITLWRLGIGKDDKEALHKEIMKHAPQSWLEHKERMLNPNIDTTLNDITAVIGEEFVAPAFELNNVKIEVLP